MSDFQTKYVQALLNSKPRNIAEFGHGNLEEFFGVAESGYGRRKIQNGKTRPFKRSDRSRKTNFIPRVSNTLLLRGMNSQKIFIKDFCEYIFDSSTKICVT